MKRALTWLILMVLLIVFPGCASRAKIAVPEEPKFRTFEVYQLADGICMDAQSVGILKENIQALKAHADELRKTLKSLKTER